MRNVMVVARKPDGTVLGSAALSGNLVSIFPGSYTGPFILEFADDGSGNGQYFDESKSAWLPLGSLKVHTLVPSLTHHVSANVLSEAAYQVAIQQAGSEAALTADSMTTVNNAVRDAFNVRTPPQYRVSDVTNYAVAVSDTTTAGSLPNTNAGRYGVLIAAMPRVATATTASLSEPAIAFLAQLALDLKDDGIVNNSATPATGQRAYDSNLAVALADAVTAARAAYGSAQQPVPSAAPNSCFNTALFAVGSVWTLSYQNSPPQTGTVTRNFSVTRRTTDFQGLDALETKFSTSDGSVPIFTYFAPDLSNGLIEYGTLQSSPGFSATTVNVPPITPEREFLLRPGQSETITTTSDVTTNQGGSIQGPIRSSASRTTTFVGYEDVTVPAGTFRNACKYTTASNGFSTTTWITSSGQGVEVQLVNNSQGGGEKLTSGTVNGQPVR
jgi:hypothetical protein